jgi:hypothetical protein
LDITNEWLYPWWAKGPGFDSLSTPYVLEQKKRDLVQFARWNCEAIACVLSYDIPIGSHVSECESILVIILFTHLKRMGSASFLDCHVEGLIWQFGDLAIPPRLSKNLISESPNFSWEAITNQSFKLLWPLSPVKEISLLCLLRLG